MAKKTADPAVLVRKSWAEKVDAATDAGNNDRAVKNAEQTPHPSLFYDVRRIHFHSEARRISSGLYEYDAYFVRQDGSFDYSFEFQVYQTDGTDETLYHYAERTWAIWRGRWELLSPPPVTLISGGGGCTITPASGARSREYQISFSGLLGGVVQTWNGNTVWVPPWTANINNGGGLPFTNQFTTATLMNGTTTGVGIRTQKKSKIDSVTFPTFKKTTTAYGISVSKNSDGVVTNIFIDGVPVTGTKYITCLSDFAVESAGTTTSSSFNAVYDTDGNL